MKKLLITTLLATTVATGFGLQAEAAVEKPYTIEPTYKVYANVQPIKLDQIDKKQVNDLLKNVLESYKLKQPNQLEDNKQLPFCDFQKPEAPVKQPEANKENDQVKQPEADKETPVQQPGQNNGQNPEKQPPAKEQEQQQNSAITQEEQQMVDLVNAERSKQGLNPLKVNNELTKVARVKAQDMISNNYFDHQSPTYGSPFEMMNKFGISYQTAGENLAGNQTVEKAHQALMNSEGHRANILGANYTEVGIGIVEGGSYGKMFVQLFKG